ncbi:MAG: hypothetical protein JSU64_05640 [candidate division WOR-3 bacterium]|nr:MAG: hypothetical protein JSU64_05640 [candidate division WOR-3 bacterium]
MAFSFAILKNENDYDHMGWIHACEGSKIPVRYRVIDITRHDWLEKAIAEDFDCFLTRPPGITTHFKQLYDERVYILHAVLGRNIYPSYNEILMYENKRMLAYWLKANNVPHPETWIFYNKGEALGFAETCSLPIVAKTALGASGSGVMIIRRRQDLRDYVGHAFSDKGIKRRWGPNVRRGDLWKRFVRRLKHVPESYRYFHGRYTAAHMSAQRWFALFQKYIDCDSEWRAVCIGDSYFAHRKVRKRGEMFSGTSEVSWDRPSLNLLDFVRDVCSRGGFFSQAVDIFEDREGNFLVNELQCFFGAKNPHQMVVDGKPGRYLCRNGQWIFDEGDYNTNDSFDLRLQHVIELLERRTH